MTTRKNETEQTLSDRLRERARLHQLLEEGDTEGVLRETARLLGIDEEAEDVGEVIGKERAS